MQESDPRVLSEQAFVHTLRMERRRTERSLQPFLLMLVDISQVPNRANGENAVSKIVHALSSATRETDTCGWLTQDAVLAVVFVEIPSRTRELVKSVIESRIRLTLRQQLKIDQLVKIRISFEFFPETQDTKPPTAENQGLYPDLYRKSLKAQGSQALKRAVDVLGSSAALVLLSPVFALIALGIRLTSKGPILFRQTRVGQYGLPFTFFKFRSMYPGSDPEIHREYVRRFIAGETNPQFSDDPGKAIYKLTSDPRVVPFGRFLRRTSLDELPQFWNVLRGDMSLVGPRPGTLYETELYQPWHRRRVLEAKPGITGLWQINGRSTVAFDEMVRLDLRYAKACSIWLDLKIILRTPKALLSGQGAY
jgi:lipopolysaccharide/colanic/teichoic acid biosynthesis glycosyltransferase